MSDSHEEKAKAIENAAAVIELFGGIRPMAKKMDVAVTTVQGWKKRNVIPANRHVQVFEAAQRHGIDLTAVLGGQTLLQNQDRSAGLPEPSKPLQGPAHAGPDFPASSKSSSSSEEKPDVSAPRIHVRTIDNDDTMDEPLSSQLAAIERQAVAKSTMINVTLVVLALVAGAFLLLSATSRGPDRAEMERLAALEKNLQELRQQVDGVENQQGFLGNMIPKDLDERLESLKEQALQAQENVGAVLEKAHEITTDVLDEKAGGLSERMERLETHMNEIAGNPQLVDLLTRLETMNQSAQEQMRLDQAVKALKSALGAAYPGGADGDVSMPDAAAVAETDLPLEETLQQARASDPALGQAFAGVPSEDLKAAALLLTMSQFRSSLNRDNTPFENDLAVLMQLVGEEDAALTGAIEKLAPQAEQGVLTPQGLGAELKTITGDIVVSSLKGEDVSIGEKAKARMNQIFQVKKDGELLTGTPTQAAITKAETYLEQGDVAAAIAEMQTLQGPAAQSAAPWIDKARATLLAQQIKDMLTQAMNVRAYGSAALTASGGALSAGSQLIRDEERGINLLKPNHNPLYDSNSLTNNSMR